MPHEPGASNKSTAVAASVTLKERGVRGRVSSITPNDQMATAWTLSRMPGRVWGFKMTP